MINLTFGEQVKIILSRKGMTIKELAEEIEAKTGKKMSRQNMTQRLSRDNFQEQDMRMIAEILGCSFQLSILASVEAERASVIEDVPPTGRELEKLLVKKEMKDAKARAKREAERDLTVGEFVDMLGEMEEVVPETAEVAEEPDIIEEPEAAEPEQAVMVEPDVMAEPEVQPEAEVAEEAEAAAEEATEAVTEETTEEAESEAEPEVMAAEEEPEAVEPEVQETAPETATEPVVEEKKTSTLDKITRIITAPKKKEYRSDAKDFQPIKQRADAEEDKVQGDVNPYTGHEYQSNSVRTHPNRIGYVQVYDRKEHKWTDMTEWAFLGFEERKKVTLGKDYEPPIYLD